MTRRSWTSALVGVVVATVVVATVAHVVTATTVGTALVGTALVGRRFIRAGCARGRIASVIVRLVVGRSIGCRLVRRGRLR